MALTGNDKTYADIMAAVQGAKDQNSINAARNRLGELQGIGAGDATSTFSSILDKAQQGLAQPTAQSNYSSDQSAKISSMYDNLKNSQLASAAAQRDNQVTELRRKLAEQLPQYQTARAQADVGQQQNFNALKEYMGNSGAFNSGDNLSRASNIVTQRGNAVNQINGNENAYTIANQNAINDANSAYNTQANTISAQYDAQKMQALADLQNQLRQEGIQGNQWQQQFDFNQNQANQSQNNWQTQFDYGKKQDTQNYDFSREQYANDINKFLSQQAAQQAQFDYQKEQDKINNTYRQGTFEWQKAMDQAQFDYQKEQDKIANGLKTQAARTSSTTVKAPTATQQKADTEANINAATAYVTKMVYTNNSTTAGALKTLTSNKGTILEGLQNAGMSGKDALAYYTQMYNDLSGN